MTRSRAIRARQSCTARQPAVPRAPRPRQDRHAPQPPTGQSQDKRPSLRKAVQPRRPRIGRGEVQKKSSGPAAQTSGRSDHGHAAAISSPTNVPGMVISSGMIFSSTSIIDAASIKAISTACAANSRCRFSSGSNVAGGNGRGSPGGSRPPAPTSHQYSQAKPIPANSSSNMGRTQKPGPCRSASRRRPSQPKIGSRSKRCRGGADGSGRDQGLIGRGNQANR